MLLKPAHVLTVMGFFKQSCTSFMCNNDIKIKGCPEASSVTGENVCFAAYLSTELEIMRVGTLTQLGQISLSALELHAE